MRPSFDRQLRRRKGAIISLPQRPLWGDSVEEVYFEVLRRRGSAVAMMFVSGAPPQVTEGGVGTGISLASLRRFCAVAARVEFVAGAVWAA
jgi:hypothetical protein